MKKATNLLIILILIVVNISCSSTQNMSSNLPKQHNRWDEMTAKSSNQTQMLLNDETFKIEKISDDKTYGYTEKNPIKVGNLNQGPKNERRFLNALAGPNGEKISYHRVGSCCRFNTPNGFDGAGFLDKYAISYDGLKIEIIIYINMYDYEELKVPVGFTLKK